MDPELTELGRQQALKVAERLGARGADDLVVSPAKRARETATPIAERLGKAPTIEEDLTEMRLPDWSALSLPEVAERFTSARQRHPEEWWQGLPGGESFRDFRARVEACLLSILEARGVHRSRSLGAPHFELREPRGRTVIVAHGGTNAVALSVLVGIASVPWEWERFALGHASILRLKLVPIGGEHVFSLRAHNDCEHLPRELRTT
jgi:probable phosphoglycerate mutase